jgi:hypothetical protein
MHLPQPAIPTQPDSQLGHDNLVGPDSMIYISRGSMFAVSLLKCCDILILSRLNYPA